MEDAMREAEFWRNKFNQKDAEMTKIKFAYPEIAFEEEQA